MIKLSVNVNKIALLRNARSLDLNIPDVCEMTGVIAGAGADGITVHPRPDERHIRYDDAYEVSQLLRKNFSKVEYNIEGNPFTGRYMEIVTELKPDQATLVPDMPGQNTSDHGWNLDMENRKKLNPIITKLKDCGIRVSLFMNPHPDGIKTAANLGTDRVELYTEPYAKSFRTETNLEKTVTQYVDAAKAAIDFGLAVNAGHDLNLKNLPLFISKVSGISEVSIGHALIADALYFGLEKTVKKYLDILSKEKGE